MYLFLKILSWRPLQSSRVGLSGCGVDPSEGEPEEGIHTPTSLEYTFKVADPLRLALFYDAGYLRKEISK